MLTASLTQTATYWGSPTPLGFGDRSYDTPIEVNVRWEERQEIFVDATGREQKSKAVVYVDQDVDLQGLLFLGGLDDLTSAEEGAPTSVESVHEIRGYKNVPRLDGQEFERKAWL